jgi:hypothetical protein
LNHALTLLFRLSAPQKALLSYVNDKNALLFVNAILTCIWLQIATKTLAVEVSPNKS